MNTRRRGGNPGSASQIKVTKSQDSECGCSSNEEYSIMIEVKTPRTLSSVKSAKNLTNPSNSDMKEQVEKLKSKIARLRGLMPPAWSQLHYLTSSTSYTYTYNIILLSFFKCGIFVQKYSPFYPYTMHKSILIHSACILLICFCYKNIVGK